MKILIINGPNINMLGIRDQAIYGTSTYADLEKMVSDFALENNIELDMLQSNCEGEIVTIIQDNYLKYDGYIINPAAYTHTSIAIYDALLAVSKPTIEVHISDVDNREDFRKVNFIRSACFKSITNLGINGYLEAIHAMILHLDKTNED